MTQKKISEDYIEDFDLFDHHLSEETKLLENWFIDQVFSEEAPHFGAEIEFFLLDKDYDLSPRNLEFIDAVDREELVPEAGAAQVEINSHCFDLTKHVFSDLHTHLDDVWKACCQKATQLDLHPMLMGMSPTARPEDQTLEFLTQRERYHLMNRSVATLAHGKPNFIDIEGVESFHFEPSLGIYGLICAYQLHIQVGMSQSVRYYNTAQAITAVMMALSTNSPYIFGKEVWHDTRVVLFDQAATIPLLDREKGIRTCWIGTGYIKESMFELFNQNFLFFPRILPEAMADSPSERMFHVRRQNGVIYRWNRPVIDFNKDGRPHLRIEHRAPSSGPTIIDMVANATFFYGLLHYFMAEPVPIDYLLPFYHVEKNFEQAARYGMHAQLTWINEQKVIAADLIEHLLPFAAKGLETLGISSEDSQFYLTLVERRVAAKQNGSDWQCAFIRKYGRDFKAMTEAYLENQMREITVAEWKI